MFPVLWESDWRTSPSLEKQSTIQVREKKKVRSTYNHLQVCGHWYSAEGIDKELNVHQKWWNNFRLMHPKKWQKYFKSDAPKTGESTVRNSWSVMAFSSFQTDGGVTMCSSAKVLVGVVRPPCGHHLGDESTLRTADFGETPLKKNRTKVCRPQILTRQKTPFIEERTGGAFLYHHQPAAPSLIIS